MAHRRWLANQKFEHAAQQIVFQEGIDAIEDAVQRLRRLEKQLALIVPEWSMALVVEAYQAMRDASFLVAVTFAAEIRLRAPVRYAETADVLPRSCPGGTLDRRYNPTEWPHLSGQPARAASAHRGGLDIPLSRESQRDLESPAGSAAKARARHCLEGPGPSVRSLSSPQRHRHREETVVVAAIAREMAAFLWAVGREVAPA
jgi:transposase